jgi:hypothetical protein
MLHLILTASTDDTRTSVHFALREMDEKGVEHTIKVAGRVFPLYEVGLFGESLPALLDACISMLQSEKTDSVSTPQ